MLIGKTKKQVDIKNSDKLHCLMSQPVSPKPFISLDLLFGCLMSQQHDSASQGRICSNSCMYCHTEIEVTDPTLHLTQSQYTDTGPTSPSADPLMPGAWQGSNWSADF